ncbi:MAG TPA: hypothetical protein VLF94_02520, partial [Chlamydiales bacterium]|nr:hypothetical protein [Chlamydiales bacterium]
MTITSLRTEFSSRLSQTTANASFSGRADDYADLLEYYCVQGIVDMRAEILANASISEEEKALVEKLTLALVNDDVTVGTKEVEEIHQMVDQLLANCDENHPYAYYYHYLKGMVVG